MWYALPGIMSLIVLVPLGAPVRAESPSVLLEKGIYAEETAGNIDEAISIYRKIVTEAQENRKFVAQASYRLGKCYLKKGNKAKAAEMFKKVASDFADQKIPAAAAIKELATLEPSWSPGGKAASRPELPAEVMQYITQLHLKAYEQAQAKGLPANTQIYGVDDEFHKYQGGLLTVVNTTATAINQEIQLSTFTFSHYDIYNEQGERQAVRWIERPAPTRGRYRVLWTPDRPIQPGERRLLGYMDQMMPTLMKAGGGYLLQMNNHFGPPVLENFFLILPSSVQITDSSANYTCVKRISIFDVYLWQRQVPADATNDVTVTLAPRSSTTQADRLESERLTVEGWRLWTQQKYEEAEKKFQQAVKKDPNRVSAWNGLGWSRLNLGLLENAKEAFEKALTLDPKDPAIPAVLNGLGQIASFQGKTNEAIEHWEKAYRLIPNELSSPLMCLAEAYLKLRQYDKAEFYYRKWLDLDPTSTEAKEGMAKLQKARETSTQRAPANKDAKRPPSTRPAPREQELAAASLLIHDDLETGNGAPLGWYRGVAVKGVKYIWDKHTGYHSKASLCLEKTENRYFPPIAQWYRAVPYKGTAPALKLSAQVKAQNTTKAILDVLFLDDAGNWISHQWIAYIGIKNPGDPPVTHNWKEYSGAVNIPAGTKRIQIGLQIYGPGTVWFDNVTVQYLDKNVPNE